MWSICQTKSDIAFAVDVIACYTLNPNWLHKSTVLHIFQYLYKSIDVEITYKINKNKHLISYSDADYTADKMSK